MTEEIYQPNQSQLILWLQYYESLVLNIVLTGNTECPLLITLLTAECSSWKLRYSHYDIWVLDFTSDIDEKCNLHIRGCKNNKDDKNYDVSHISLISK